MNEDTYMNLAFLAYLIIGIAYAIKERKDKNIIVDELGETDKGAEELIKDYQELIEALEDCKKNNRFNDTSETNDIENKIQNCKSEIEELVLEKDRIGESSYFLKKFAGDDL